MGKPAAILENARTYIILGNGGLIDKRGGDHACDEEEDEEDDDWLQLPDQAIEESGAVHKTVCEVDRVKKSVLSLVDCEADIQPQAISAGLELAHKINSARGRLGQVVGMGTLFDIPRGFNEMDAFDPELRDLDTSDPRRITVRRLETGPIPTADDLAPTIRDQYLAAINSFNLQRGSQFRLSEVDVLTAQRARRELARMARGAEGYPNISQVDSSERGLIYDRQAGNVVLVHCAGVYAATNWFFHKKSDSADIYAVWSVDKTRVKGGNRKAGSDFARRHLGVHKVVDRVLSSSVIVYVGEDESFHEGGESLWTMPK
ncbi:MAG: hypothetical protein AAB383_06675 [Patescibacteria group bacterium]